MENAILKQTHKSHVIYYDLLNIFACVGVIALHVNGAVWNFSYDRYWVTSLIIETVFYWAVPIFFMLSGATLIEYRTRYNTVTFFKKRIFKTVIPFLFWSAVSIPWGYWMAHTLPKDTNFDVIHIIDIIFNTRALSIYWFFIPLFATYLSIPILSLIPKDLRQKAFEYLAWYAFLTFSCLPLICHLFGISFNGALSSPISSGYILFTVLGYLLSKKDLPKKIRCCIYGFGIIGWALRYFMTLFRSYAIGKIDQTFYGYVNFPSVLLAVAVFVWFRYHDWSFIATPQKIYVIQKISSASFGIYLIHFYFLRFVVDNFHINMCTWQWRILGVPFVYIFSLVSVLILKKIPVISKLVP
jgi:surface polysaccharide O-acyltransferase-like enzyme